jgi:hypothetical protein
MRGPKLQLRAAGLQCDTDTPNAPLQSNVLQAIACGQASTVLTRKRSLGAAHHMRRWAR